MTDEPYRATTADLCALAFVLPWTLAAARGAQFVTVFPVRTEALSRRRTDDGVEPCHLHTADFVEAGGRWGGMLCGQNVKDLRHTRYKSLTGVVLVQNDDLKGHAFVGAYETPPWQEVQFNSHRLYCGGPER